MTPEQRIDAALDSVLKASGSALRHYTMPKTLADMREAMRKVMFDEYIRGLNDNADPEQKQWMNDLYDAADAIERAPRWRDVADELPQEAQEVLFVRGGKTVHGAWIGGIFWHSNQKMAAAYWMPLPLPPNAQYTQQ